MWSKSKNAVSHVFQTVPFQNVEKLREHFVRRWRQTLYLMCGDAEFSLQSPLRSSSHPDGILLLQLERRVQRVTAARVRETP